MAAHDSVTLLRVYPENGIWRFNDMESFPIDSFREGISVRIFFSKVFGKICKPESVPCVQICRKSGCAITVFFPTIIHLMKFLNEEYLKDVREFKFSGDVSFADLKLMKDSCENERLSQLLARRFSDHLYYFPGDAESEKYWKEDDEGEKETKEENQGFEDMELLGISTMDEEDYTLNSLVTITLLPNLTFQLFPAHVVLPEDVTFDAVGVRTDYDGAFFKNEKELLHFFAHLPAEATVEICGNFTPQKLRHLKEIAKRDDVSKIVDTLLVFYNLAGIACEDV